METQNMNRILLILLILPFSLLCLHTVSGQLTGITLDPPTVTIAERANADINLSIIQVVPAGTIVNCDIKQVDSGPAININDHPFQRSFNTLGPNNVQWYVYYDDNSPNKLEFDTYPDYDITVECAGITGTASAVLVVKLVENQAPDVTGALAVSITRDANAVKKGDLLYTVTATDPDMEPLTLDYQIVPPVNYFNINPVNNEIRADVSFLAVDVSPLVITVTVSDGDKSVQLTIDITVTNLNSRPEITNLPDSIILPENTAANTELILLEFIDPDELKSFFPACTVTPNTQTPVFITTGSRIKLATGPDGNSLLDYETITTFQISCTIFDDFLLSDGTDILTVQITDVNEAPVFDQFVYNCLLQESKAMVSSCVLGMNIQDPEGNSFTVSLVPSPGSSRFKFTSPTAESLTFSVEYDVDNNVMPDDVTLTVQATDSFGQTSIAEIHVTILDVNDNDPILLPNQIIDITSSTLVGNVGTIRATDADSGINSELVYTITDSNPPTTSQYITLLDSGQLIYSTKFPDSIKDTTALLTVTVTDKGISPKSTNGLVTLRFLGDISIPTTVPVTNSNLLPAGVTQSSTAADEAFFDEPANIAIVAVLGVVLLVLLFIAFYFCIKRVLLGHWCGPRKPSNVYPDNYRFQRDYHRRRRMNIDFQDYSRDRPQYNKDYTSYSDFVREKPFNRETSTISDFFDERSASRNKKY